jgi:hypothetical protein
MDELQEHVHTPQSLGAMCYANVSRTLQLGHGVVESYVCIREGHELLHGTGTSIRLRVSWGCTW